MRERDIEERVRRLLHAISENVLRPSTARGTGPPIEHGDFLYDEHGLPK